MVLQPLLVGSCWSSYLSMFGFALTSLFGTLLNFGSICVLCYPCIIARPHALAHNSLSCHNTCTSIGHNFHLPFVWAQVLCASSMYPPCVSIVWCILCMSSRRPLQASVYRSRSTREPCYSGHQASCVYSLVGVNECTTTSFSSVTINWF